MLEDLFPAEQTATMDSGSAPTASGAFDKASLMGLLAKIGGGGGGSKSPAVSRASTGRPGLDMILRGAEANRTSDAQAAAAQQHAQLVAELADKVKNRDYAGAASTYSILDPEGAKALLPQLMQADPSLQEKLAGAQESGKLSPLTNAGANTRQITDANNANAIKLKQMDLEGNKTKNEGKLTDKQDRFAQDMFGKVTGHQDFKNYQEIRQRLGQIQEFATNPSAFGDVGAITGFAKSIDPGSVVRPSEYESVETARSLVDRVKGSVSKLEKGEVLTPQQRTDLVRISQHMNAVYKKNYEDYVGPVYKQAAKRGVTPDLIDPFYEETSKAVRSKSETPAVKPIKIQGTGIEAVPGQQVRSKSTGKIMTVQSDGSLK